MTQDNASNMAVLPNPPFEGSEKRLEVDFSFEAGASTHGLRGLTREQLDSLMTLAHCCIVSSRSNDAFDAYVLSESSLFVYPSKWVLKTCGTTRLLDSVPLLLELAGALGMTPLRCKFSRASFLFPEQQHFPHTSFDDEVQYLDKHFSALIGSTGNAYVLGDPYEGLQWHKYVAGRADPDVKPTYNLEICMTELGEKEARQFFRSEQFVSAEQTTRDTGIVHLKPRAVIDDYVFEPCGYSMNGILDTGLITIHITPETGHSYASVEVSGFAEDITEPNQLLAAALKIFAPGKVAMALSVDQAGKAADNFGMLAVLPSGYSCPAATAKKLECGGSVTYYNMVSAASGAKSLGRPDSPTSILHHALSSASVATLHHALSCASVTTATADSDGDNSSEEQEQDIMSMTQSA